MGCKFSSKDKADEDEQITSNLTANQHENPITKESEVKFKVSELIGEKKGNIEDFYVFEKILGEGAFGKVKLSKHKATGLQRAVKIISKANMSKAEENSLRNEIEILRNLDHPHILKVYEYFSDKNNIYIVTEYCSGGELFDRIVKAGSLSEKKAAGVMNQILLAINYCHKHDIVHRDLKPENILYDTKDENSSLKIIDFGTSAIFNSKTKLKEHVGTAYYVAPEVLKEKYDNKCDLWSCGVILYILLSGFPPFRGDSDDEILDNVEKGTYNLDEPELASVSKDAKNFIKKLLTYNPEKRISAQDALQDPWLKKHNELSDEPLMNKTLMNMKTFRAGRKIQLATWSFFTNFLTMNEEKEELLKVFKSLDTNGDGQLTREELLHGYTLKMGETQAKEIVDEIMKNADIDQNGRIEYNEFLMISINREKMLSKDKLVSAFKLFDEDGNGYISLNEFRSIFCKDEKIPIKVWEEMISAIDENKDGKVSCEEFVEMMKKLLTL